MNDIKEKITELFKDKRRRVLAFIGVFCLGFLLLGEIIPEEKAETPRDENTSQYASEYIEKAEKELEKLLESISGAGKVEVMITLDSAYENVFAKGYKSNTQEKDNEVKSETEEEYIIVKQGSNNEQSLIVKVYEPQIKGVAVIAQGAEDVYVRKAITEAVCALYDISSARVSVSRMR